MKFELNIELVKALVGEFVGSCLFLWLSLSSLYLGNLGIAFAFGFNIAVLVFGLAEISGGHLNPAVTLALVLEGKMEWKRGLMYVLSQMGGACLGAVAVYPHAGANIVTNLWQSMLGEVFGTFLLVFTVFTVVKYPSNIGPLHIGLSVFVSHLALIDIDGCSINPARSFATAVSTGVWKDQWVFWLCPLLGSVLAVIAHK